MKQDDVKSVPDSELLFRLVPPSFARRNAANIIEITSGVFHTIELSALRLCKIDFDSARQADPTRNRVAKLGYGIALVSAHFVRHSVHAIVCLENDREYPDETHVGIYRSTAGDPLSKSQWKGLAFGATLVIPPKGV